MQSFISLLQEENETNTDNRNYNLIPSIVLAIQEKIQKRLYGSMQVIDYIIKNGKEYLGVLYRIGDGNRSIRFDIPDGSNNVTEIDFWFQLGDQPNYTIKTDGFSLRELIDPICSLILTGNSNQYVVPGEDQTLTEAKNIPFDLKGFMKFVDNKSPIYVWIKDQSVKDKNLEFLLKYHKLTPLHKAYNIWAKANKMKQYSYAGFRNIIVTAYHDSHMLILKKVPVEIASPESNKINLEDEKLMREIAKFKLTPNEIFLQIEDYVAAVANGRAFSLVVAGDPGLGKTYGVTKKLKELGYHPVMQEVQFDPDTGKMIVQPLHGKEYVVMSGTITPVGVYGLMYAYNGSLLVFDDCDSLFDDEDGINLLKGALDDKPRRTIGMSSARTTGKKSSLPPAFPYTGRAIFITNRYLSQIDSAIKSRALIVEVNLTPEQIIERIRKIMPNMMKDVTGATMGVKNEVLNYLLSIKHLYRKLDLRTFEQAVKERLRGSPIWKKLVGRLILAKQGIEL